MFSSSLVNMKNLPGWILCNVTKRVIDNRALTSCFYFPYNHLHLGTADNKHFNLSQRESEPGLLKKFIRRTGWLDLTKAKLRRSGTLLYESVADQIPYMKIMVELKMPDTFYSWFLITELHVWMLMVRIMAEKEEGRFARNCMIETMWKDVNSRAKMINHGSSVKEDVYELSQQFQAALMCYDEGLQSDDKILAGAVWRRFYQKECNEPEDVECLVKYIRQQIKCLDHLAYEDVLLSPKIKWIDLKRNLPP